MKQAWKKLANNIDSRSLRERSIIFAMVVVIFMAIFNSVLLDPQSNKEKALSQQLSQAEGEIQTLQQEMLLLIQAQTDNPDDVMQSRLGSIKKQLAEINSVLRKKQQQLISPDEITQVLKAILIQNRKLQLLSLSNLPTAPLIESELDNESTAITQTDTLALNSPDTTAQIFKHGVEITVQGGYFDLLAYLNELEKIPSQMFWERVSLNVGEYPSSILTLSVYTLSLDKTWLKV